MITSQKKPAVDAALEARIAGLATRGAQVAKPTVNPIPQARPRLAASPLTVVPQAEPTGSIDDLSDGCWELTALLRAEIKPEQRAVLSRRQLARIVGDAVEAYLGRTGLKPGKFTRREMVTSIMQALLASPVSELASPGKRNHLKAVEAAKARSSRSSSSIWTSPRRPRCRAWPLRRS